MTNQMLMQLVFSGLAFIIYLIVLVFSKYAIKSFGAKQKYHKKRIIYIKKSTAVSLFVLLCIVITIIWGIEFRNILIFVSSLFAVVGIALFASWSILSNVTSGVIIFFAFPYKIGDSIIIADGEISVEGEITDMTMFHIKIKDTNGNTVLYPNNLAIQRPIVKKAIPVKTAGTKSV